MTYWKEADPTSSYVKVFKHTDKFIFEESTTNQLNGLEMEGQSQMFMLDINGDMLTDYLYMTSEPTPVLTVALT